MTSRARQAGVKAGSLLIGFAFLALGLPARGNLLMNGGFEEGLSHWQRPEWYRNGIDPRVDRDVGRGPGHASVTFVGEPGKGAFAGQRVSILPGVRRYRLTCWVRTQGFEGWFARAYVECRGDNDAYLGICGGVAIDGIVGDVDWRKLEAEVVLLKGTRAICVYLQTGGPGGKLEPPNRGTVWFDDLSFEELVDPDNALTVRRFEPLGVKGLFTPGQSPEFMMEVLSGYETEREFALSVTVSDFDDRIVSRLRETVTLKPLSSSVHRFRLAGPEKVGFHAVNAALLDGDRQKTTAGSSFCVVSPPEKRDTFFGMTCFNPGDPAAIRLMGAGSIGYWIGWRQFEPKRSEYRFEGQDLRLQQYLDQGLRPIGFFDVRYTSGFHVTPGWAQEMVRKWRESGSDHPYPPEYYQAWGEFVEAVVRHYKDRIKIWQLFEEVDLSMEAQGGMDRYVMLVRTAAEAAKRADPECIIGGVGVSGADGQYASPRFPVARRLWPRVGDVLDGMFFNAYIDPRLFGPGYEPAGPERGGLKEVLLAARDLVGARGTSTLAIDEKGMKIVNALPVDSPYAKDLAKVVARSFIVAKSVPEVERYMYFMFDDSTREDGADYGLWLGRSPRPTVAAYATTARLLTGTSDPVEIGLHKDIYLYVFKKGAGSVAALWTILKNPVSLSVRLPGKIELYDLMGNSRKTSSEATDRIVLTDTPLFVTCVSPADELAAAIAKASFSLPLVKTDVTVADISTIILHLANQTQRDLDVKIDVDPIDGAEWRNAAHAARVPAGRVLPLPLDLKVTDFARLARASFAARMEIEGTTTRASKDLLLHVVPRAPAPMVVDGDLGEYQSLEPLVLDKVDHVSPPDALPNKLWTGPEDLSIKTWVAYDEENLYFAARVTDDEFAQNHVGRDIWVEDSLQIAFDTKNDALDPTVFGQMGYDSNDYEYGIALTQQGPQCFCWFSATENENLAGTLTEFPPVIRRVDATTTDYEWAIPWEKLAPLRPVAGTAFGCNWSQFDRDKDPAPLYSMALTHGICAGKDPSVYRTFVLGE